MGLKGLFVFVCAVASVSAQNFRVCVQDTQQSSTCQSIGKDDSQVACQRVYSRLDCALQLARGQADIGYFTEEETLLLAQQQPNDHRVIATVRDVNKMDPVAFETVAIVPSTHTNGLAGLKGGVYCHPGLDETEIRWSPRVRKTLEQVVARTDACSDPNVAGKTAEEVEVEILNSFFSAACRPGTWSFNSSVDASLKSRFPNLCSLCGLNSGCSSYTIDMGVGVAGVRNDNRHIQALECLRTNSASAPAAVAYVAWQHVREYFTLRNPQDAASYSVMCTDGTLMPLSIDVLNNSSAPCTFLQQPWGTIVASTSNAATLLNNLRTWWPTGANPGGNSWQAIFFSALVGGANARVVYQDAPISVLNYTTPIRPIAGVDATAVCLPARRWCTISAQEQAKCNWVRAAAYTLGIETILCQQRASVLECLSDIKNERADLISAPSNYGYLARQHYQLTPVKLVQNPASALSRIAAFVKETAFSSGNITRFENLRGRNACFPEFGGLAYVSFVRAGQERGILSAAECDYAKAVGEFFGGACAPGAIDAAHALSETSSFDSSILCSTCRSAVPTNSTEPVCSWDYSNQYFGNNGSLACLADANNDVAFLNMQNVASHLTALGLQGSQFRALCRNNSMSVATGFNIDDDCLLAHVVDAEIVVRRNDPLYNSVNALFDSLDYYFGYDTSTKQLIDLQIFSPFDGVSDLLFKDSTIDLTEPTITSTHGPAKRYIELFQHLQACTGTAPPVPGLANRSFYSLATLLVMAIMTRFVIY